MDDKNLELIPNKEGFLFEIEIPKGVKNIEGGYGNVKLYEGADGSLTYHIPNKDKRIS